MLPAPPWPVKSGYAKVRSTVLDTMAEQIATFVEPDDVTELRALHVGHTRGRCFAGWFTGRHLRELARHALSLSRDSAGVYFVMNRVNPELLARRRNTCGDVRKSKSGEVRPQLTRDADVLERRYLLVDLDPVREAGQEGNPSSDDELARVEAGARNRVMPFLRGCGWAEPVMMMSGSGIHLVYRYTTPLANETGYPRDPAGLILLGLAGKFNCSDFVVDPNTSTPTRHLKVPGTMVRRGKASPTRPYRVAKILETPAGWIRTGQAQPNREGTPCSFR